MLRHPLGVRLRGTPLIFGPSWLLVLPVGVWAAATYYIPVLGPFLREEEGWLVAVGAVLLIVLSVAVHGLAHLAAARLTGSRSPERVPLYPLGDAAQRWPAAPDAWSEALAAMAGPLANALVALGVYVIWDRHLHPMLNAGLPLVILTNALIVAVNLAPGFPLDGGRLARAAVWGLLRRPDLATPAGRGLGWLAGAALLAWGVGLLVQPARFHLETGAGTLLVAGLLGVAMWSPASPVASAVPPTRLPAWAIGPRLLLLVALLVGLFLPPAALLPTLNGLYAPGYAVAVEPMVTVDPAYRRPHRGNFLLTSVVTQTPILAGQWLQSQVDPAVTLVPPEQIVPRDTTPRQMVARSFNQLEDSALIASVVALRLAGHTPRLTGNGAVITGVAPDSPSTGLLRPGDHVVALDGAPIGTAAELVAAVRARTDRPSVSAIVERDGQRHTLTLPLIRPTRPGEPPRLGVAIETAGFKADLPFSVKVEPVKIVGGPSAGLVFALTIYNLITGEDLTGDQRVAGTGTLTFDGVVGPIGGVTQKVVAAEQAGASYFLVPRDNADEARRVARRITIIPVGTVQEAIDALRSRVANR